ncbi:tyrosine-type recombinase/integrase [Granulicella sibirica]|nr:tyrosine-type recombinase/integrase [Granulicella sibirica]
MSYNYPFRQRAHRERHLAAPFLEERNEYLNHLLQRGTSVPRVQSISRTLLSVIHFLRLDTDSAVTVHAIDDATKQWKESIEKSAKRKVSSVSFDDFRRAAINWMQYRNLLIETPKPSTPYGDLLPNYIFHIKVTRGMTAGSVKNYYHRVLWFLRWAEARREVFADITLQDVEQYIAEDCVPKVKLRTVVSCCGALRTFFRYAEREGLTANRIATGIIVPSVPRYDPNPRGPRWREVRMMISAASGEKSTDLRARAILLLLSVYGLRSSEVTRLSVDDIDWFDESILIRRAKHGGSQRFPLQYEVGDAILRYLRQGRPACECRSLFVTVHTPFRAIPVGALLTMVRRRAAALGIKSPQPGPRGLRHSCATQLLHKGHSLAEISDFLGHRNPMTVSVYAKSSSVALRKVAAFSLGGLR